ncbi:MAG TPA: PAS domain S-box protein, partial [Rhizomicrobium sp.]
MTAPTRSRSEELLDLAQEAGGLGLFEWDIAQARITLSPRYLAIHGLDAFDGRYESWLSCIHREDRVRIAHLVDSVFADKRREWHAEYRIVGADSGELKWLEARNIVAYGEDGAPRRVVGVIVDVTQHKRSTAALQAFAETLEETVRDRTARLHASEGLIATFFRHSPECHAVMVEAGEGRFRYEEVNPATLQLYNMARQDVVGFTVDELFGAEAAGELDAHLTACLRSGLPHRYERVQGQSCVEAIATPVPQEPGALRRIVVSARDVTERRRLEDQLRQTQKMEAIGQLTGGG